MNPNPPPTPSDTVIAERARALWRAAGRPEGQDLAFWLNAENKLRDELAAEYDHYCALVKKEQSEDRPSAQAIPPSNPAPHTGKDATKRPVAQAASV
jgi:hypothetical protein